MFKRLVRILWIIPLLLLLSCKGDNTNPTSVSLATFHVEDSTFSFQAPVLFERIVDEPNRIMLQYENARNPDYSNMLIITRKLAYPNSINMNFVEEEVHSRNAKGKFQLQLVEGCDSVYHYRFSEGPTDIDDWYMIKKGEHYNYSIYYAGEQIGKKEAFRLLGSIVENEYVIPSYLETHDGKRLYTEINLEVDAKYDLVKSLKIPHFIVDKDVASKRSFFIYTSVPYDESFFTACIGVFEVNGDINDYFLDFIEARKKKSPCEVYTYQGNSAIEFTCFVKERKPFSYGRTICFVYKNRFYQVTVISSSEERAATYYYDFVQSIKLV